MGVLFEIDLDTAGAELDRLAKGPVTIVPEFEGALLAGFALSLAQVHVITGQLKASGHPSSSFDGSVWEGTQGFARYPGIYELARGNRPTRNHPEGHHYFMERGGPEFLHAVRTSVWEWVTSGQGGTAPSGGLGPYSGGDVK